MRGPHLPAHFAEQAGGTDEPPSLVYYDDFFGEDFRPEWSEVTLNTANSPDPLSASGGVAEFTYFNDEAVPKRAVLDHGNVRHFDIFKGLIFECRVKIATGMNESDGGDFVWGVCDEHSNTFDNIQVQAWFRQAEAAVLAAETDDDTNFQDDVSTGMTLAVGDWHTYTIDFRNIEDVCFHIDGRRKCLTTAFDMSAADAWSASGVAGNFVQPYFGALRGSGPTLGAFHLDYVKLWQNRA